MTIDKPEDAARRDTGDALIGGEVGISREHADQLAPDPPDAGDPPAPPKAAAAAPGTPTQDRRAPRAASKSECPV